jgi:hypothetical protein
MSAEAARAVRNAVLAATAADEARRFEERPALSLSLTESGNFLGGVLSIGVKNLRHS